MVMWEHADSYKLKVKPGTVYLLRLINAALDEDLFFTIANHTLTVVEADAVYVKQPAPSSSPRARPSTQCSTRSATTRTPPSSWRRPPTSPASHLRQLHHRCHPGLHLSQLISTKQEAPSA